MGGSRGSLSLAEKFITLSLFPRLLINVNELIEYLNGVGTRVRWVDLCSYRGNNSLLLGEQYGKAKTSKKREQASSVLLNQGGIRSPVMV